jgi:probable F420-dependent oxidoreductase
MTSGDFRFGVNLTVPAIRDEWKAKCREAEDLGYNTVAVPDHLGMPSPFPALVLAAEATDQVRVGTFVMNTAFYNPTLFARDVVGTDQFTAGRLELGLGAGYVKAEFDKAGLTFDAPGRRIDHLVRTIDELERCYADADEPNPAQQGGPPLLIAGSGDRLLRLAAERASVISFAGAGFQRDGTPFIQDAEKLDERVSFVTTALNGRPAEFNIVVMRVKITDHRTAALQDYADRVPNSLPPDKLADLPICLFGTAEEIADQLRAHRDRFGFTYFTVLEPSMHDFAKVITLLS